jgi:hypothetical protein
MIKNVWLSDAQIEVAEIYNDFIDKAVASWTRSNNDPDAVDYSDTYYNKAQAILQVAAEGYDARVTLDRGVGLYPTIELDMEDKHYCEYTAVNFFLRLVGWYER